MEFWAITNISLNSVENVYFTGNGFNVYIQGNFNEIRADGKHFFTEGYIVPSAASGIKDRKSLDNFITVNIKNGSADNIIKSVKGMHNILFFCKEGFTLANDNAGMMKFFVYSKNGDFILSNSLKVITDNINAEPDYDIAALYCLMEHNPPGYTIFRDIGVSMPGSEISFLEGSLVFKKNNTAGTLTSQQVKEKSIEEMSVLFRDYIKSYTDFLTPKRILLTITGGNDSRMVLAALLDLSIEPDLFSFGNPDSYDCVVSKKIAEETGLSYNNYYVSDPSEEWLECYAGKIVMSGNSLINIHRAHRLFAAEMEKSNNPLNDLIMTGLMGGDYIRGINFDDYITPAIIRLWWAGKSDKLGLIRKTLTEKYINPDKVDLNRIYDILSSFSFIQEQNPKEREVLLNTDFIAPIHDFQDTKLFFDNFGKAVNIFMDSDFLKAIFGTRHNMMHKNHVSNNFFVRLKDPELACGIIDRLCPALSRIEFAKNYSPSEFLGNKAVYASKRIIRKYTGKKYPANFPYLGWYVPFVMKELERLSPSLGNILMHSKMMSDFNNSSHGTTEKYWHKFTNIINLSRNIDFFTS